MTNSASRLDLKGLIDLVDQEHKEKYNLLDLALQSIAKRQFYCLYHFDEFIRQSNQKALLIDRFNHYEFPERSIRTSYEANALAFLQNLHALFDSYPFILNLLFEVELNLENRNIGWNKSFIKKFKNFPFYNELTSFWNDIIFCQLKGFVNRGKHKHLIRIQNKVKALIFEDFTYIKDSKEIVLSNQDVRDFLVVCFDDLFPKFIKLYNTVKKYKKTEIDNM